MKLSKVKVFTLFTFVLMSVSMFAASVSAYVSYKYNPVTAQVQEKTLWCWAATSSMAGKYLGATNATQTNIVTFVKGSAVNDTGTVYDMKSGLGNYNVKSTALLTTISFGDVIYNVEKNMNMISVISWSSGGGHALLIRGYYQDTGNSTQNVYYIDPADGSYNSRSYSSFSSNSSWTWGNTLSAIYV
jgi:hypothetical protein